MMKLKKWRREPLNSTPLLLLTRPPLCERRSRRCVPVLVAWRLDEVSVDFWIPRRNAHGPYPQWYHDAMRTALILSDTTMQRARPQFSVVPRRNAHGPNPQWYHDATRTAPILSGRHWGEPSHSKQKDQLVLLHRISQPGWLVLTPNSWVLSVFCLSNQTVIMFRFLKLRHRFRQSETQPKRIFFWGGGGDLVRNRVVRCYYVPNVGFHLLVFAEMEFLATVQDYAKERAEKRLTRFGELCRGLIIFVVGAGNVWVCVCVCHNEKKVLVE